MSDDPLSPLQQEAIASTGAVFLHGAAGTGKSTIVAHRLLHLLEQGEPAYAILVLVSDRTQREAYENFIQQSGLGAYADLQLTQFNNLAREMVTLFWPLVASKAGFASSYKPPTFLGYDLAQLLMWRTVTPMREDGAFGDLRRRPQQIVSQLLDTLNRAALNNLDIDEATLRQIETWTGEKEHVRNLQQAQEAASLFRQTCLDQNLLDLSLTIDTFSHYVLEHPEFSRYFGERFRHFLVDNVEEQTPAGQRFITKLMAQTESSIVAYDAGGGYRRFLAADPIGSNRFRAQANKVYDLDLSFTSTPELTHIADIVDRHLQVTTLPTAQSAPILAQLDSTVILDVVRGRYRREMVFAMAEKVAQLIHEENVHPSEIAIVLPYLDGAMRYMLTQALKQAGVPMNLVRRRATPREEPRVRAWLTWMALAHPQWDVIPSEFDVAEALTLSIAGLDPARAALLAQHAFANSSRLAERDSLPELLTERIGEDNLALYEQLRVWLDENGGGVLSLDNFLYRLFADLLSTRDFQPEPDVAGAAVCDWLVKLAGRLVDSAESLSFHTPEAIGEAFLTSINQGLITSEPPEMGDPPDPEGVIISTLYGYLLRGQSVRIQVWLETAATGWWDIPRQPLSNAFVLAESWDAERSWTMLEEIEVRNELLSRIVRGLTSRCSDGIILASSDLDRRGQHQDGPLWRVFQAVNAV